MGRSPTAPQPDRRQDGIHLVLVMDPATREVKRQLLENRSVLLTESFAGRVVEVNPEGEPVWEWINPPRAGDLVADISRARRYSLSREDVARGECSQGSP